MKTNSFTKLDISRGLVQGVLETGFGVFIILIAERFWDAPSFTRAALAGGGSIGLILTPLFCFSVLKKKYRCTEVLFISIRLRSFYTFVFFFSDYNFIYFFLISADFLISGSESYDKNLLRCL